MSLIRRNPGTCWFIASILVSFVIGVWQAIVDYPIIERTVMQCWMLTAVWAITYYNARWVGGLFRKYKM